MRMTSLLAPTLREAPSDAETISHQLMLRAGLIRKLAAGIYTYLPLGWRVLHNVESIVREEMDAAGAQEVLLPVLHPAELWKETERWGIYGKELMRIEDRHEREFCLGPTHEEVITDLVRNTVKSYRELPVTLYQIQVKFRDEIRPRFGVMRSREFIMKDAYSFDRDVDGLEKNYQLMRKTYQKIFDRCGFNYVIVDADPGAIGGGTSEEFMVLAESGEDEIAVCESCGYSASRSIATGDTCGKCQKGKLTIKRGIEVGHIFKLGTRYSVPMHATFSGEDGSEQTMIMGCYGIGVSRIVAAIIEQQNDKDGIKWPVSVAPFDCVVIPVNTEDAAIRTAGEEIYASLRTAGFDVLLDDRNERAGVKFKDADLMGHPLHIVIGPKTLPKGEVEIKLRMSGERKIVPRNGLSELVHTYIRSH